MSQDQSILSKKFFYSTQQNEFAFQREGYIANRQHYVCVCVCVRAGHTGKVCVFMKWTSKLYRKWSTVKLDMFTEINN